MVVNVDQHSQDHRQRDTGVPLVVGPSEGDEVDSSMTSMVAIMTIATTCNNNISSVVFIPNFTSRVDWVNRRG